MKSRLAFAVAVFAIAAGLAYGQQAAQVVGPITPGNCAKFNSTTIIADAGVNCASGGGGNGTVTSVALSLPNLVFSISGSPVVNNGTLTGSFQNQAGHTALMGANSGASGPPTFRAISGSDLPLPTAGSPGVVLTGGPTTSQYVFAVTTSGGVLLRQPSFSELSGTAASGQLPIAGPSTFGVIEANAPLASNWVRGWTAGIPDVSQPQFTDIGGSIDSTQLPSSGNNTVLSNIIGSTSTPLPNSVSAVLDSALGSTQFSVIYRGSATWTVLTPGVQGQFLATSGASNPPVWANAAGGGTVQSITPATSMFLSSNPCTVSCVVSVVSTANNTVFANTSGGSAPPVATSPSVLLDVFSSTQGSILQRGSTIWGALTPGTAGFFLQTQGPGATNTWAQPASTNLSDTVATTSWTPTDGSGAGLALTINDAKYYKIGKLVTIMYNITYPATANASASKIAGLPVAPYTGLTANDQFCIASQTTGTGQVMIRLSITDSTFQFWNQAAPNAAFANSSLSTRTLSGSCTYVSN